jgi:hypothetical protein
MSNVFEQKYPETSERHVGIEIEFYSPTGETELGQMLTDAGLARYCQLKDDGSIRAPGATDSYELTICVPENRRHAIVTKVCSVLKKAKAGVNASCGLHIHLDMRSRDQYLVYHNLVASQPVLYAMNPPTRQSNGYCNVTRNRRFASRPSSKYFGINGLAYSEHETIEVRIHAGTCQAKKINNWIDILLTIASRPTKTRRVNFNVLKFANDFKLSGPLVAYIGERVNKFKDKHIERKTLCLEEVG